jgi:hypothetical protein
MSFLEFLLSPYPGSLFFEATSGQSMGKQLSILYYRFKGISFWDMGDQVEECLIKAQCYLTSVPH